MIWIPSHRADDDARQLADRHYSRQKVGSKQFVAPGRCIVLKARGAYWVTSWPFAEYVKHAWAGAWICSAFRREDEALGKASDMIRQAVAATRHVASITPSWGGGGIPSLGMVSFIDPLCVSPRKIRSRPTWGHSWFEAGFKHVGYTKAGLWAFQLDAADMPAAAPPLSVAA